MVSSSEGLIVGASGGTRHIASMVSHRERAITERRRALSVHLVVPRTLSGDVRRILALIHEHALEPRISVKSLRAEGGARDHNVSSRFKVEVGLTIGDYITTLRVHAATELLGTTSLAIADIAYTVGYEYLQTFYRDVRRVLGTTPGAIRRKATAD